MRLFEDYLRKYMFLYYAKTGKCSIISDGGDSAAIFSMQKASKIKM